MKQKPMYVGFREEDGGKLAAFIEGVGIGILLTSAAVITLGIIF